MRINTRAVVVPVFALAFQACFGQALRAADAPHALVGVRYSATRASSPPGSCGCFFLQGAALDAELTVRSGVSGAVELAGSHAATVPGTTRQLSTITLMAGPRYRLGLGVRQAMFGQAVFGAVRGFDADFRRGSDATDTATSFAYSIGGAYEVRLSQLVTLRAVQLDLIQTNLPNGTDNRQRNLRLGAGIAFHVPLGIARR